MSLIKSEQVTPFSSFNLTNGENSSRWNERPVQEYVRV